MKAELLLGKQSPTELYPQPLMSLLILSIWGLVEMVARMVPLDSVTPGLAGFIWGLTHTHTRWTQSHGAAVTAPHFCVKSFSCSRHRLSRFPTINRLIQKSR